MNNFETVIGIEIHIELNTKTKMFSHAPVDFNAEPNTMVSGIDIAYPGSMPVLNKQAVVKAIKLAKALGMDIDDVLHFDRKNYFYPDLPKGYQITQNLRPIGKNGAIPIFVDGIKKIVEIERIHLEEDTAKSFHGQNETLLDYNRAGVPLIEIVSDPVLRSGKEASAYVDAIRQLVKSLDISDAKMEEGSLRADVNISLRPYGTNIFGTRMEVKNVNTLSNIEAAVAIEERKLAKAIISGDDIFQSTKRFDESKKDTIVMREKTGDLDYRFYPEPNIPPIQLSSDFIDEVTIGELPWVTKEKLEAQGVADEYVSQLMGDANKLSFFNLIKNDNRNKVAKVFFAEVVSLANSKEVSVWDLGIDSKELEVLISKQDIGEISGSHMKKIIPNLVDGKMTVQQAIDKFGFKQISDEVLLNEIIDKILVNNKDFVDSNKERKERVEKFVLGLLMKETKGQANPVVASKLVNRKIG